MGSGTGSKMVLIVFVYFLVLFSIVPLVMMASGEGGEANIVTLESCSDPRLIYEPYSINAIASTDEFDRWTQKRDYLASLSCSESRGVLDEDICTAINGCNWDIPPLNMWNRFLKFLNFNVEEPDPTCLGNIDASYYGFETTSYVVGTREYIAFHENTDSVLFSNRFGSICDHPNVITDETLCDLFSCSWGINNFNYDVDIGNYKPVTGALSGFSQLWSIIGSLFTFSFDWGTGSSYADFIINLFLVYLPTIILMFGIYVMIRS